MTTPRYLLAKYMPDILRAEPRNIGIVLWTPDAVAARFVAEKPKDHGEVDGRRIPDFVTSQSAYKQWIQYWCSQLESLQIEPLTGGNPINRSSPEYLEALKSTSNGNFVLTDGGFLLDDVASSDIPKALEYLYATLVDVPRPPEAVEAQEQPFLQDLCTGLLKRAGIYTSKKLLRPYTVTNPGTTTRRAEKYKFSYAIPEEGTPRFSLYHRVSLPESPGELQKSVYSSNWMFQSVIQSNLTTPEQSGVIVYADDEQRSNKEVASALESLGSVTRVFNLYNQESALLEEWSQYA